MTRDDARAAWAQSGLTYLDLTTGRLQKLRDLINGHMRVSGLMRGTFRMHQPIHTAIGTAGPQAELRCRAQYFKDREAVTFNSGGRIGFAGWADEDNVAPILKGFVEWVGWMDQECTARKGAIA